MSKLDTRSGYKVGGFGVSAARNCIGCLFTVGLGVKRIMRFTGFPKTSLRRIAREQGAINQELSQQRKRAEDERRGMAAEQRRQASQHKHDWMLCVWPRLTDAPAEWKAARRYRGNHEDNKRRCREFAKRRYDAAIGAAEKPNWLIASRLRTRLYKKVTRAGLEKKESTLRLLGCTLSFFRQYMQARFTEGMSWANHGEWEIDHIIPCASFDLSKRSEQRRCFHYSNLQPLWRDRNRSKSDSLNEQTLLFSY